MRRQRGLTLVELIVVIAIIIAILGLFLLPICDEALWRSKIAACVSNLKQIGAALQMYAEDWNGYAPPYTNESMAAKFSPQATDPMLMEAAYAPYAKGQIWYCPFDLKAGQDTSDGLIHKFTSYKIPARYATPIPIYDPPLIVPPFEKPYDFSPKELKCVICMGVKRAARWIYASDSYHERLFQWERINLLLNGRVVVYRGGHGAHECPAKELPEYWPFADWP